MFYLLYKLAHGAEQIFAISAGKRAFPVTTTTVAVAKEVPRLSRSASSIYQTMGNVTSLRYLTFLPHEGTQAGASPGLRTFARLQGGERKAKRG